MIYTYMALRGKQKIAGLVRASQPFEALHNARYEVLLRGGDIRGLIIQ